MNGAGLQQDFELLRDQLLIRGHTVQGVQFNAQPLRAFPADINIFIEVVQPAFFRMAQKQWVIPHPEWWFAGWGDYQWDLILAKTHDTQRIFSEKFGNRCLYTGWLSRDMYRPGIPRERRFLHVQGKSSFKNTLAVSTACDMARVHLTLINQQHRVSDAELITLMNSHFCHIMPSAYEGFGHVLHEALGAGQVIITTDAPPMNELTNVLLVPSVSQRPHHAGILHGVSPADIATRIREVLQMSEDALRIYQHDARAQYEKDYHDFQQALDLLVGKK